MSGCSGVSDSDTREVINSKGKFSDFSVGQEYEVTTELWIIEYDYLLVPLVKPGIQANPPIPKPDPDEDPRFALKYKITGYLHPGNRVKVVGFNIEGGWIPCKGDYFESNPMARVESGPAKDRIIGISLLSLSSYPDGVPYRTGKMIHNVASPDYLRKCSVSVDQKR